jgi:hypothetical protein
MRGRTYLVGLVALAILVVVVVVIRFEIAPRDLLLYPVGYALYFVIVGLRILSPLLLVAGVVVGAWLMWGHFRQDPVSVEMGPRRARLGYLASLMVVLLIPAVGAVAYNARIVSCSMADAAACPRVRYEDIQFPGAGFSDPYFLEFREPVWPDSAYVIPEDRTFLEGHDWAALYRTWFDGDWWAACRRLPNDSITCIPVGEGLPNDTPVPGVDASWP